MKKKYFTTGLVILLPVILTILVMTFLVNFLTRPFLGVTGNLVTYFLSTHHLFLDHINIVLILSKLLILMGLFLFTLLIGFLGKLFLIDYLFKLGDALLHHVPFINKIYKACQDIVHSLFSSSSKSFSQVVFVPFPSPESLSVGLVTKESILIHSHPIQSSDLVPVFVPGTPNPSVGFLMMFQRKQLIFVDMKVDEAMKFVVSCGVVMPDFSLSPSKSSTETAHES